MARQLRPVVWYEAEQNTASPLATVMKVSPFVVCFWASLEVAFVLNHGLSRQEWALDASSLCLTRGR